jgi:hypothetical protein
MVDLVNDAAWDLLVTVPTTLAGVRALVRYVRSEDEQLFDYFMGIGMTDKSEFGTASDLLATLAEGLEKIAVS